MSNLLHPDFHKMRWLRLETRATTARLAALQAEQDAKRQGGFQGVATAHLAARKNAEARIAKI